MESHKPEYIKNIDNTEQITNLLTQILDIAEKLDGMDKPQIQEVIANISLLKSLIQFSLKNQPIILNRSVNLIELKNDLQLITKAPKLVSMLDDLIDDITWKSLTDFNKSKASLIGKFARLKTSFAIKSNGRVTIHKFMNIRSVPDKMIKGSNQNLTSLRELVRSIDDLFDEIALFLPLFVYDSGFKEISLFSLFSNFLKEAASEDIKDITNEKIRDISNAITNIVDKCLALEAYQNELITKFKNIK